MSKPNLLVKNSTKSVLKIYIYSYWKSKSQTQELKKSKQKNLTKMPKEILIGYYIINAIYRF